MVYKDSDYTVVIAIVYNFGAETHLGGGDTSAFAAIARALPSTFIASTALMNGPQRF